MTTCLGVSPRDAGDAVGAQLVVEEPRTYNIVFSFHLFKIGLRAHLDFVSELIHQFLVVADDVEQDDLFLIHLLQAVLELFLRSFEPSLKTLYFMLVVVNKASVALNLCSSYLTVGSGEPLR